MTEALTVGDFSRMTHLSVKTLRHYHQVGLLEPDEVNPQTGYRYYSVEQIPAAQVIRRLRDLEMPVAEVKAVLAAPDSPTRNALIAGHLDRLENELAQTRAAVDSLRNLLERPANQAPVEHRSVAAMPSVAITEVVDREDVVVWWEGALGELHATVHAQRLTPTGPSGGLFASGLFQYDQGEATVFIPVEGRPRAVGRVASLLVPATELAIMVHHGSLDDIDVTYGQLGSYAAAHEISIQGPLRECYRRDRFTTSDPAQWETELGWPIFRADAAQQR